MTELIFRRIEKDPGVVAIEKAAAVGYKMLGKQTGDARKRSFAPSSLVYGHGKCPRYWQIAFNGAEFVFDDEPASIANMKNGTDSHTRLQDVFFKAGALTQKPIGEDDTYRELRVVHDDPPIFGYLDLMFDIDGEKYPAEIKTSRQDAFAWRKTNKKGSDYHLLQLLIYLKVFDKKKGFLIYENKETYELLILPVEMTPERQEVVENVFDWMRQVRQAYMDDVSVKRGFRKNNKICKSCPVAQSCDDLPVGDLKIPTLEFDL